MRAASDPSLLSRLARAEDIGLYEPLLTAAAQAKMRLVAGFPSRAEAREAVRGSMDASRRKQVVVDTSLDRCSHGSVCLR